MYQTLLTWQHQSWILFGIITALPPKLLLQHINIKAAPLTTMLHNIQVTAENQQKWLIIMINVVVSFVPCKSLMSLQNILWTSLF